MKKVFAVVLFTALLAAVAASGAPPPNLIIINIEDLGYADIGPFGSNNQTPHPDRMAREGPKLTSHYAAPVCPPSRAAFFPGVHPRCRPLRGRVASPQPLIAHDGTVRAKAVGANKRVR